MICERELDYRINNDVSFDISGENIIWLSSLRNIILGSRVYMYNSTSGKITSLITFLNFFNKIALSPNRKLLALSDNSQIHIIDLPTRDDTLAAQTSSVVNYLQFSPEGDTLAYKYADGRGRILNLRSNILQIVPNMTRENELVKKYFPQNPALKLNTLTPGQNQSTASVSFDPDYSMQSYSTTTRAQKMLVYFLIAAENALQKRHNDKLT
ncbi:MAG: hypothetical protein K2X90_03670 [Candidatus Babeliaceae bacterium]|nr:hypothetical protein [Candidatus Babeliaceae bacterium]